MKKATSPKAALFSLGQLVATPGALQVLEQHAMLPLRLFARHSIGDWGEIGPEDAKANADAIRFGARILSSYRVAEGVKIWVITEADRSGTTLLLASEY
jgi:hypothetical protein